MTTPPPDLSGFSFDRSGDQPTPPPASPRKRRRWPYVVAAVVALLVVIGLVAPKEQDDEPSRTAAISASPAPSNPGNSAAEAPMAVAAVADRVDSAETANAAFSKLQTLPVKDSASAVPFSRDEFGQEWSDDVAVESGHNGCDTRDDILRRDLTKVTLTPGSKGCAVSSGTLNDLYTGRTAALSRLGSINSGAHIDHVVSLPGAWQTGAQNLSAEQRRNLANDPRNLQAVEASTATAKNDGDAAAWLVPDVAYRCTYVSRQIDVKAAYSLWVTQGEKAAMTRVLTSCGAAPLPAATSTPSETRTPSPTTPNDAVPDASREYVPAPAPIYAPPAPDGGGAVSYGSCAEARAAGAAPIYAGQPGYSTKLDRDRDGIACDK